MKRSRGTIYILVILCTVFVGTFIGRQDVYFHDEVRTSVSASTTVQFTASLPTPELSPSLWKTPSTVENYTPLGIENTDELWWENLDSNKTLYVAPFTGLSNTLQTIASALTTGYRNNFNVKVVFSPYLFGQAHWNDFFSFPQIDQNHTFPDGELYMDNTKSCNVTHQPFEWSGGQGFDWVQLEDGSGEICCVKGCCWRERPFPQTVLWFYKLLRPAVDLQLQISEFKEKVKWDEYQWVGVHVRRTDNMPTIIGIVNLSASEDFKKSVNLTNVEDVVPIEKYINVMRSFVDSWAVHGTEFGGYSQLKPFKFFLATDNAEARETIVNSFEEGKVVFFDHQMDDSRLRDEKWGMKLAVVDMFLLASCKVTVATAFSTFSEAAHMIGGTLYMEPNFKYISES